MLMRHPLEQGVRVIAAHCGTLGTSDGVPNFELFSGLMQERKYEGLLFGDISAICQANRAQYLPALLAGKSWHGRLLNGTDYPLPGVMPITSLNDIVKLGLLDEKLIPTLRSLRESNSLLFDFTLKRNLRLDGQGFPAAVFETRPFFERV